MTHAWPLHDPCREHPCMPQSRNALHRMSHVVVLSNTVYSASGELYWQVDWQGPRICGEEGSSRAVFCWNPNAMKIEYTLNSVHTDTQRPFNLNFNPASIVIIQYSVQSTTRSVHHRAHKKRRVRHADMFPSVSFRQAVDNSEQFSSKARVVSCSSRSPHHSSPAPTPLTRRHALIRVAFPRATICMV